MARAEKRPSVRLAKRVEKKIDTQKVVVPPPPPATCPLTPSSVATHRRAPFNTRLPHKPPQPPQPDSFPPPPLITAGGVSPWTLPHP